jgi:hypothetical protein
MKGLRNVLLTLLTCQLGALAFYGLFLLINPTLSEPRHVPLGFFLAGGVFAAVVFSAHDLYRRYRASRRRSQ